MIATEFRNTGRPRLCLAAMLTIAATAASSAASANVVAQWNAIAADTITPPPGVIYPAVTPEEQRPSFSTDLATVHVAIYDAVNAITGGYEVFAITPRSPTAGASPEAAAGAAACRVLQGLFPNRAAQYATPCLPYQASSQGDEASQKGIAVGIEVANGVLALRANDGRSINIVYVPGSEPGDFRGVNPVNTFGPYVRPFTLTSAAQFRADGPPALGSATYAADFNEVKRLGAAGSVVRTPEQEEIARFHTEAPPRFWPRNLRSFASDDQSIIENARLMAMLWVAQADVGVGCFESKYVYEFWRPQSAIPLADTDGNPATIADPSWTPVVPTPNHPEYPAAHACVAGAMAEVLRSFFGTKKIEFTFTSTVTGTQHEFDSTDAMVSELQVARIYGGMHFRTSTVHGKVLGTKVGKWVSTRYFRPVANR
jgi:VCPO second helical-bundle domain